MATVRKLKFKSLTITATATRAPLSATDLWCESFAVQNNDATNEVFIGDSTVTASTGWQILKGGALSLDSIMNPTSVRTQINLKDIYAICSATETAVLVVGYMVEVYE